MDYRKKLTEILSLAGIRTDREDFGGAVQEATEATEMLGGEDHSAGQVCACVCVCVCACVHAHAFKLILSASLFPRSAYPHHSSTRDWCHNDKHHCFFHRLIDCD